MKKLLNKSVYLGPHMTQWNGAEESGVDLNSDPFSDPQNLDLRSSFSLQNSWIWGSNHSFFGSVPKFGPRRRCYEDHDLHSQTSVKQAPRPEPSGLALSLPPSHRTESNQREMTMVNGGGGGGGEGTNGRKRIVAAITRQYKKRDLVTTAHVMRTTFIAYDKLWHIAPVLHVQKREHSRIEAIKAMWENKWGILGHWKGYGSIGQ